MPARLEDAWVRESDVQESVESFWEYPFNTWTDILQVSIMPYLSYLAAGVVLDDSRLREEITAVASAHVGLDVGGEVYQCLTLMED
jgi:hypothetical protein